MYKKTFFKKKIKIIIALALTTSAIAVSLFRQPTKKQAFAAKGRPIASNNIPDGEKGYIKLTKTATTTSIKDVWKIELGVSGKNPPPTFVDAMLMMDTSESMSEQNAPGWNALLSEAQIYNNKSRIFAAKKAAEIFVDTLWDEDYQVSKYRIGAKTTMMKFKDPVWGTFQAWCLDLFKGEYTSGTGNWEGSAPAKSIVAGTSGISDIAPDVDSAPKAYDGIADQFGKKAQMPTTAIGGQGLVSFPDKAAFKHNLNMLTGTGFLTNTPEVLQTIGTSFYSGVPSSSPTLVDPPEYTKLYNATLAKDPAEAAKIKIRRAVVILTDGAPNARLNGNVVIEDSANPGIAIFDSSWGGVQPEVQHYFNGDPFDSYDRAYWNDLMSGNSGAGLSTLETAGIPNSNNGSQVDPNDGAFALFGNSWAGYDTNPFIETEALIRKFQEQGFEVHVVGLNINNGSAAGFVGEAMFNHIANTPMPGKKDVSFVNITTTNAAARNQQLKDAFEKIAQDLRSAAMKATVYDQIADEFELYRWEGSTQEAEVEYSFYQKENALLLPQLKPNVAGEKQTQAYYVYDTSAKTFEWRIDNFADYEDPDTMTYYIKLKPGFNVEGKTYATNGFAYIEYTNVNSQSAVKFFPNPFVSPDGVVETPNPQDEFPKEEEFNDLVGYTPSLPSEGWKKPSGTQSEKVKEPTLTKEQAAANAAGKTLEEIAKEKKEAKKEAAQAEAKAKDPNTKMSNEQAREQQEQEVVEIAQKNVDREQKLVDALQKVADQTKKISAETQKNKSKTPEQKLAAKNIAQQAQEKLAAVKAQLAKTEKDLNEKKQKLEKSKSKSALTPTPSPTPEVTEPEATPEATS